MFNGQTDNRGVILVFTLLIMAILLSTAIGFSYFIMSDINKAKAIDDSIIAYYAADAGMEESLYLYKKEQVAPSLNTLKALRPTGKTLELSGGAWSINDSTDYEKGFLRQRLYNGQSIKFFVLNRNAAQQPNETQSLSVYWLRGEATTAKLQVTLTQLVPQQQDGSLVYYTDTSVLEAADSVTNASGQTCYLLKNSSLPGNPVLTQPSDYVAELKVLGSQQDFVDRIEVKAYNNSECKDVGVNGLNEQGITNVTLKSRGHYGRADQSIVAQIVPQDPVSGLLGFVLFSENDITKE